MSIVFGITVIGMIGYAHFYNGDASIDQELLAVLLGLWTVVTFWFLFKEPIYQYIGFLHEGKMQ